MRFEFSLLIIMKYYKFEVYEVGRGAECFSFTNYYYSKGIDLSEAKQNLVKEVGCIKTYFDDPEYTKVIEITKNEYLEEILDITR